MERFAVIDKQTGKILKTYTSHKLNRSIGGYYDDSKYDHVRMPSQITNINLLKYDCDKKTFIIDEEIRRERADRMRKIIKEEIHLYMWRWTDWSQLPDVRLTNEEKLLWRKYREFLRDYDDYLGDLSLLDSMPEIPSFETWKRDIARLKC